MKRSHTKLGRTLRRAREDAGKSLRAVAHEVGISPSYLSNVETGRRVPAESILLRLAYALALDVDDVLMLAGKRTRLEVAAKLWREVGEDRGVIFSPHKEMSNAAYAALHELLDAAEKEGGK